MEDAAHILSEFLYSIENVPGETAFLLEEIGHIDTKVQGGSWRPDDDKGGPILPES